MCALIVMCCYDTEENGRTEYTVKTLRSLKQTVDWKKHRLAIIDNNSCQATKNVLNHIVTTNKDWRIITLPENVGTARGINIGLRLRKPGEHAIKMDNDIVANQ